MPTDPQIEWTQAASKVRVEVEGRVGRLGGARVESPLVLWAVGEATDCGGARAFMAMGVGLDELRQELLEIPGADPSRFSSDTPTGVFDQAAEMAARFGHDHVTTCHLAAAALEVLEGGWTLDVLSSADVTASSVWQWTVDRYVEAVLRDPNSTAEVLEGSAVAGMADASNSTGVGLRVIQDDERQAEALGLVDELEQAIADELDRDPPEEIAEFLTVELLPRVRLLREVLTTTAEDDAGRANLVGQAAGLFGRVQGGLGAAGRLASGATDIAVKIAVAADKLRPYIPWDES